MEKILNTINSETHSRMPVFEQNLDNALGFFHIKDFIKVSESNFNINSILREVLYVAPKSRILDLLKRMRSSRIHMGLVVDEFGGVDILVNNAGFGFTSTVIEMTEEDWDRVLGVNLKGQFLCSKAAALSMIKTGTNGRIVNIASTAAVNGRYAGGAYCAAKAGVVQLTKVMSMELGEYGINVNQTLINNNNMIYKMA